VTQLLDRVVDADSATKGDKVDLLEHGDVHFQQHISRDFVLCVAIDQSVLRIVGLRGAKTRNLPANLLRMLSSKPFCCPQSTTLSTVQSIGSAGRVSHATIGLAVLRVVEAGEKAPFGAETGVPSAERVRGGGAVCVVSTTRGELIRGACGGDGETLEAGAEGSKSSWPVAETVEVGISGPTSVAAPFSAA
jgi:hypothetical protein